MFQSNLGYMWPRVSRNDHGLGRWLSRKRCPQSTLMTSVWPLGPMEWQEKWTAAICPLTSSLHHVHITTTTLIPGSVCVQFSKMGLVPLQELHSHGIVPPRRRLPQHHWLREPVSYLFLSSITQFPGKKSQLNYLLYLELNAALLFGARVADNNPEVHTNTNLFVNHNNWVFLALSII